MPSQKWLESRRQVKFYLDAETYANLKAALNGRPVADMLRDAVQEYIKQGGAASPTYDDGITR